MPVWLHPLHGPDAAQRFQPHKLQNHQDLSRGEKLTSCLKSLVDRCSKGQDFSRSNLLAFADGEVVTKYSPTGVDFNLPLLCADVTWTRIPTPELDASDMQTPFDRAETEEIPDLRFLIGLAPRWKRMQMAALESFDNPGTDEVWVLCASFHTGTREMETFLQTLHRGGALRWDIDEEYIFHKEVIGRGFSSITRRGLLRRSFRELACLVDEHSHSEEEAAGAPCDPAAIKIMKHPDTDDEAQSVVNEVRFLAESAQHPNVVKLHGTFCVKWRSKSRWLLALEMCSGGRLRDHVKIYGHLERIAGEGASVALLSAVAHLHSRRVLHRDIQPGNILLAEYLRPVLINFGNACRFEDAGVSRLSRVDGYTAPEVADARLGAQGPGSDVFSLGACILFLLTGVEPFIEEAKCAQRTLTGNPTADELAASKLGASTATILQRLLMRHAQKRPTAWQACVMLHEEACEEVHDLPVCEQAMEALSVPARGSSQSGLAAINESEGLEEPTVEMMAEGAFGQALHSVGGSSGGYMAPGPPTNPPPADCDKPAEPGGEAAQLLMEGFRPQPPSSPSPRRGRLFSGRARTARSQE